MTAHRADDLDSAGVIIEEIWASIQAAEILVADLSGRNANVFYEVGLAHALDKPVLILAQALDDLPFDLRHRRAIIYRADALHDLEARLVRAINHVRRHRTEPRTWLATDRPDVKVGVSSHFDKETVYDPPLRIEGFVIGLPTAGGALKWRIQAFVLTDVEYAQDAANVGPDGYWSIERVYLGGHRHSVFFRIYDPAGGGFATSEKMVLYLGEGTRRSA